MKKIHRAFNTFYLLAKNSFSAVEGGEGGAEFLVFLISGIVVIIRRAALRITM